MKLISYISLLIGIALITSSILLLFTGIIRLILTVSGIVLIVFGILTNRVLRGFFITLLLFFI